jgi:beta-galactosidase
VADSYSLFAFDYFCWPMLPKSFLLLSIPFLLLPGRFFAQGRAEWQNPEIVELNREPMRAASFPFRSAAEADQGWESASNFESLNGLWKFKWVPRPSALPEEFYMVKFEDFVWDNFPVPSNWEFKNYGLPVLADSRYEFSGTGENGKPVPPQVPENDNPVGIYRRSFDLKDSWLNRQIFIHLGAVKSAYTLYCNGRKVGYSEDSKLGSEFDITSYLHQGINHLTIQVFRYSDASYLECQDFWRISGIERDVYLFSTEPVWLRDFTVRAGLTDGYRTGTLGIGLALRSYETKKVSLTAEAVLKNPDGKVVWSGSRKLDVSARGETTEEKAFQATLPGVLPWSAETPNLYRLEIRLKNAAGEIVQVNRQDVGFRTSEIRDGLFLVNGRPIKLRGVNRHEHDPDDAHVVSEASMLLDIKRMKELNINAVRTAHYPSHPRWYELCNRYGLYVVDEANIESKGAGLSPETTLAGKPEWRRAHVDRNQRMVVRDKNQPCVLIWSMGNRSGQGSNFIAVAEAIRRIDPTRPLQYEGAGEDANTDLVCPSSPAVEVLRDYASRTVTRPFLVSEFAQTPGNPLGNLKECWSLIRKTPRLQGGFFRSWADQGIRTIRNGNLIFGYGREWNPDGINSDSGFSGTGLVNPDREPGNLAAEVKRCYSPVGLELNIGKGKLRIRTENRHDFIPASGYAVKIRWFENGNLLSEKKGKWKTLRPGESREWLENIPAGNGGSRRVEVLICTAKADSLLPAGHVIVQESAEESAGEKTAPASTGSLGPARPMRDFFAIREKSMEAVRP